MKNLSPLIKGLITGILMVILQLVLFYNKVPGNSPWGYLVYATFAGGIIWTLWGFSRSDAFTGKFGELFNQGFRCFIMITIVLVVYVYAFRKTHPEIVEEMAQNYREQLVKEKDRTPQQIDELVQKAKDGDAAGNIQLTIFATLIMGAFFTAATAAGILIARKNKS